MQGLNYLESKTENMCKKAVYIVLFGLLYNPFLAISQDSIPVVSEINEEKLLKFQDHFFEALAQKAIFNYQIAIENLEICNELKPNDVSVMFEFSKNYVQINKYIEAVAYGKQALQLEPDNKWVLEHLANVYVKSRNFTEAIKIQEKLAVNFPKKKEQLVYLYFRSGAYEKAKKLLEKMEENNNLNSNLRKLQQQFSKVNLTKRVNKTVTLQGLIKDFESNRKFETLYKILMIAATKDNQLLLKYSTLGVALFPAQAIVYVMNAKALNTQKRFSEALQQLKNGIDFVIDNRRLEARFYDEFSISYEGLGNKKAAIKSKNKALELRKKIKRI